MSLWRRPESPRRTVEPVCESCGANLRSWHNVTQSEDGVWRCTSCHMADLRARVCQPGDLCLDCDAEGQRVTVRDHIDTMRAVCASEAWRTRFASRREPPPTLPYIGRGTMV